MPLLQLPNATEAIKIISFVISFIILAIVIRECFTPIYLTESMSYRPGCKGIQATSNFNRTVQYQQSLVTNPVQILNVTDTTWFQLSGTYSDACVSELTNSFVAPACDMEYVGFENFAVPLSEWTPNSPVYGVIQNSFTGTCKTSSMHAKISHTHSYIQISPAQTGPSGFSTAIITQDCFYQFTSGASESGAYLAHGTHCIPPKQMYSPPDFRLTVTEATSVCTQLQLSTQIFICPTQENMFSSLSKALSYALFVYGLVNIVVNAFVPHQNANAAQHFPLHDHAQLMDNN